MTGVQTCALPISLTKNHLKFLDSSDQFGTVLSLLHSSNVSTSAFAIASARKDLHTTAQATQARWVRMRKKKENFIFFCACLALAIALTYFVALSLTYFVASY